MPSLFLVFLVFISLFLIAGFCALGLALKGSRPGYQDANGFHDLTTSDGSESETLAPVLVTTRAEAFRSADEGRPVPTGLISAA